MMPSANTASRRRRRRRRGRGTRGTPPCAALKNSSSASGSTPGRRDVAAEPVDRQQAEREQDPLAQIRDREDVAEALEITPGSSSQVPPAASIFSRADLQNLCADDGQRLRELAVAEDLDPSCRRLTRPRSAQRLGRRPSPLEARRARDEVHHRVLVLEDVGEAALRHPADERHLAAFEAGPAAVAGAGLLALLAAAGGLAVARARAAADALPASACSPWRGSSSCSFMVHPRRLRRRYGIFGHHAAHRRRVRPLDLVADAAQAEALSTSRMLASGSRCRCAPGGS